MKSEEKIYIGCMGGEFYAAYSLPKKYKNSVDIIMKFIFTYLERSGKERWEISNKNYVERDADYISDIYKLISPRWVMFLSSKGLYDFFLFDEDMIVNYFISNWEKCHISTYDLEKTNEVKNNYKEFQKLAIIREII